MLSRRLPVCFILSTFIALLLGRIGLFGGPGLAEASSPQSAMATVPGYSYTPTGGGPGTVVSLHGDYYYGEQRIEVHIGFSDAVDVDGWPLPVGAPLAVAQVHDGGWSTTITIPGTLPSGKTITSSFMYLVLTDDKGR